MNARRSDEATSGPSSRRRGMRIGGRLLLLLAVPLVGLLSLTGLGVYTGAQDWQAASELTERTDVALAAYQLVDELQAQRSSLVESGGVNPESLDRAKVQLDILDAARAEMDPIVARQASTAVAMVDGAQRVANLGLSDNAALSSLSPAIDSVLRLANLLIDPAGLVDAGPSLVTQNLALARAASSEEYDRLRVLSHTGDITAEQFQTLIGLASAQRSYLGLASASAPDELAVRIDRAAHGVTGADPIRRATFKNKADADFAAWESGIRSRGDELADLQTEAEASAVAEVAALSESSRQLLVGAATAAALTLIITVMLLRRALRSIARPLEHLAARAEEIATVDLPEAVKAQQDDPDSTRSLPKLTVTGAVEVAEVAAAFNDVQDTALRLAGEQAVLRVNQAEALTNLGRRNQTLLGRQLNYLSTLERDETDPVFLEHLFKLDHLASRMRRNAESLLILAGSETPRIRRKPAKMTDIIRAAMSEVEDFERVRIGNLRDDTIVGPVVIDVIHLLAELLENALSFSPPGTEVVIEGGPLNQGGYHFAIMDEGVGMVDVEFIAANKRLAGQDELEGMPTRYLGQYVVAKLATKTGALVRLQPGMNGRGVVALVSLPTSAMVGDRTRGSVSAPRPGSKESRNTGPAPFAPGSAMPSFDHQEALEPLPMPDLRDTARAKATSDEASPDFALGTGSVESPDALSVSGEDAVAEEAVAESVAVSSSTTPEPSIDDWLPKVDAVTDGVADVGVSTASAAAAEIAEENDGTVSDDEINRVFGVRRRKPRRHIESVTESVTEPDSGIASERVPEVIPAPAAEPTGSFWREPIQSPAEPPLIHPTEPSEVEETAIEATVSEPIRPPAYVAPLASATTDDVPTDDVPVGDVTTPTSRPATPEPAGLLGGPSLQRRVPGASLANRNRGPAEGDEPAPERSADQVRSRLASFQAGRSRGRTGTEPSSDTSNAANLNTALLTQSSAETHASLTETDSDVTNGPSESGDTERSQDWRSTP